MAFIESFESFRVVKFKGKFLFARKQLVGLLKSELVETENFAIA